MSVFDFFRKDKKQNKSAKQGITSEALFKTEADARELQREKNEDQYGVGLCSCEICDNDFKKDCQLNNKDNRYLKEVLEKVEIDESKESILLLDDNTGVLSFLMDDLKILKKKGLFNYTDYNIILFDSKLAGFKLRAAIMSGQKLNVKYAIFDITLGGTLFSDDGENISLDGVDCFIDTAKVYPKMNYLFYTGNKLNPYIKRNEEVIKKFKEFAGEDIDSHILFKTTLNREERQDYLLNFFTGK